MSNRFYSAVGSDWLKRAEPLMTNVAGQTLWCIRLVYKHHLHSNTDQYMHLSDYLTDPTLASAVLVSQSSRKPSLMFYNHYRDQIRTCNYRGFYAWLPTYIQSRFVYLCIHHDPTLFSSWTRFNSLFWSRYDCNANDTGGVYNTKNSHVVSEWSPVATQHQTDHVVFN